MKSKQTGWPFQEGYASEADGETLVFTDYRWNDGTVVRRWSIDPNQVDLTTVALRPFSLDGPETADQ